MSNKIKVFEVKKKDKRGNSITEVHILGSLLPEPDLRLLNDEHVKVVNMDGVGKQTIWYCPNCYNDDKLGEDQYLHYYKGVNRYICNHCGKKYEMVDDDPYLFEEVNE